MIDIKNIPIKKGNCEELLDLISCDSSWGEDYFIRPKFSFLPDEEFLNKNLEGLEYENYLIGLDVISEDWICVGFLNQMFRDFGLIVTNAYPVKIDKHGDGSLVLTKLEHIFKSCCSDDSPSFKFNI